MKGELHSLSMDAPGVSLDEVSVGRPDGHEVLDGGPHPRQPFKLR